MRIPIIRGAKMMGEYHYFLPQPLETHKGQWLKEEEFVAQFVARYTNSVARCADPRCNEPLNPSRIDQKYCDAACSARYRNRKLYRENNALPAEEPREVAIDTVALEIDLRAQLARSRVEVDQRPSTMPPLIRCGGTDEKPAYIMPEQARKYHSYVKPPHSDPMIRFLQSLEVIKLIMADFDDEQYEEFYKAWIANEERQPTLEEAFKFIHHGRYFTRQREADNALLEHEAAKARCAKLYPNMDNVTADGGLKT